MTSRMTCPECDLVQAVSPPPPGGTARCARCGAVLARRTTGGADRRLALSLAAAILFLIANAAPVVTMESGGGRIPATIAGTAAYLWSQHRPTLAALVLATAVLMPALEIGLGLLLLVAPRAAVPRAAAARLLHRVRRWSMPDVLVVATLATLARLASLARVQIGWGLWALLALMALRGALPLDGDVGVDIDPGTEGTAAPAEGLPARAS